MNQFILKLGLLGLTMCTCIFSWDYGWSSIVVLSTVAGILHENSVYEECIKINQSKQEASRCLKINKFALWGNLITIGIFLFYGHIYIKERDRWEILYIVSMIFLVYTFTYVFSRILAFSRFKRHVR